MRPSPPSSEADLTLPLIYSVFDRLPLRLGVHRHQRAGVRDLRLGGVPCELTSLNCRYVDHLHENFEYPCSINSSGHYNVSPLNVLGPACHFADRVRTGADQPGRGLLDLDQAVQQGHVRLPPWILLELPRGEEGPQAGVRRLRRAVQLIASYASQSPSND